MNIHFKDQELFENLNNTTLYKALIGSSMYGTTDSNSDTDYLSIYVPSISEMNSFYKSHHQLQYKENDIDYNFVNIFSFFKNCINGDSTINFEIIFDKTIKDSSIGFLYEMRESFYNYKILRSYLGLCNRDLRELPKASESDKNKRIAHIYRGLEFYKMIRNRNFDPVITDKVKEEIFRIKKFNDWKERKEYTEYLKIEIEENRKDLTKLYDSKEFDFPTFMSVENQIILDKYLNELIISDTYKDKSFWFMDMKPFYEANEDPEIKY